MFIAPTLSTNIFTGTLTWILKQSSSCEANNTSLTNSLTTIYSDLLHDNDKIVDKYYHNENSDDEDDDYFGSSSSSRSNKNNINTTTRNSTTTTEHYLKLLDDILSRYSKTTHLKSIELPNIMTIIGEIKKRITPK